MSINISIFFLSTSGWLNVLGISMSSFFESVKMSRRHNVWVAQVLSAKCQGVKMSVCQNVKVSKCCPNLEGVGGGGMGPQVGRSKKTKQKKNNIAE